MVLVCSLGLAVTPAVWLFPTPTFLWPLLLDVVLGGVLWGGQGLAIFALPLAVAPRQGRPFYLAAFSTVAGLSYAAASAAGGGLAAVLPQEFTLGGHLWVNIHVLFLLSAVARLVTALLALRIQEPGMRSASSLGALVEILRPGPRARPVDVALSAPGLAEPRSAES